MDHFHNAIRASEKTDVEGLKAKIALDYLFLERLIDGQRLKADAEGLVRARLEATRRNFPSCFPAWVEP